MEEKIFEIVSNCSGIIAHARLRQTIANNYEIIYRAIIEEGIDKFVAHTWTMLELFKMHGRSKVERMLNYSS